MRIPELQPQDMTPDQHMVAEAAATGKRGRMPAPLRAWLHSPEMGDRAQRLGEFLRYDTCLGPALSELAILVTARAWTAQFEWYAHKREALAAGIDPATVDAIAARRRPEFTDDRARAVHDYATEMHRDRTISPATHAAAVAALGTRGVVELVGLLGYYTLVAMTLNAFDIGVPEGETAELQP